VGLGGPALPSVVLRKERVLCKKKRPAEIGKKLEKQRNKEAFSRALIHNFRNTGRKKYAS